MRRTDDFRHASSTYQQMASRLCASLALLVILVAMSEGRIDQAVVRLESALARIDAARVSVATSEQNTSGNSERVSALVNSHEKMREEVADTLRALDKVIAELGE